MFKENEKTKANSESKVLFCERGEDHLLENVSITRRREQNCNLYSKHSKGTKLKMLFSVFVLFFFRVLLKLTFCVKAITSVLLRFSFWFLEMTKTLSLPQ